MKKLATAMLSLGLLAGTCTGVMAAEPEIYYNGNALTLNQPAIIQDGRTLLGVRDMAEQMGVNVTWDNRTRIATVEYEDKKILLQPDLRRVIVNGNEQTVDVGPQILNDRIYLPVRYLFEMLDSTVDYQTLSDGTAKVSVFSKDSYVNYYKVNGRETQVLRSKNNVFTGAGIIMLHDGNVVDATIDSGKLMLLRTDRLHQELQETSEAIWQNKSITAYELIDDKYYAVLDETQSSHYVGNGYHPAGEAFLKEIYTPQGEFAFFGSEAGLNTYALETKEGFTSKTVKGYLARIPDQIKESDYAFSDRKTYGFLTDGQLLIIINKPGEGYQVQTCDTISNTMRNGKLFSQNGCFFALASDTTTDGKPDLFVTIYSENGRPIHSYSPVSHFSDLEQYRYLNIEDAVQIGDKAYVLLRSDVSRYLGCYDLTNHTFTSEKLNQPYERFIPAKGSWQLFYSDKDYYHFLSVK